MSSTIWKDLSGFAADDDRRDLVEGGRFRDDHDACE
jgi:hypothetical protein